jgi:OTU domain-containing protein 3
MHEATGFAHISLSFRSHGSFSILGTYGGHLELSAFAHYSQRDVKVIQPGLVYVIEWFAGWDPSEIAAPSDPPLQTPPSPVDSREKRRMKRDKVRADQEKIEHPHTDASVPPRPIYVA